MANKKDYNEEIKPLTLKIKRGTWEIFKSMTPRTKTLNETIVQLIHKEIQANSRPATEEEIDEELKPKKRGRPENKYFIK